MTVLIVDDNEDAREMLAALLDLEGHVVVTADCGENALKLELPDIDGYELARQMRLLRGKRTRLVALTGYDRADDRRRVLAAGFEAHLVKPVEPERLIQFLRVPMPRCDKASRHHSHVPIRGLSGHLSGGPTGTDLATPSVEECDRE